MWLLPVVLAGCGGTTTTVVNTTSSPSSTKASPSPGPRYVKVPNAVGLPAEQVKAVMAAKGLSVFFLPLGPGGNDRCYATDQDPPPGSRTELGGYDRIHVDLRCAVPNVVGIEGRAAVAKLEAAGFDWHVDKCYKRRGELYSDCTVIGQKPVGGAEPGTEVKLSLRIDLPAGPSSGSGEECDPSYPDVCLDPAAYDYDCASGTGDGPEYVEGPLTVLPPDPYGLDGNGDGIGCDY